MAEAAVDGRMVGGETRRRGGSGPREARFHVSKVLIRLVCHPNSTRNGAAATTRGVHMMAVQSSHSWEREYGMVRWRRSCFSFVVLCFGDVHRFLPRRRGVVKRRVTWIHTSSPLSRHQPRTQGPTSPVSAPTAHCSVPSKLPIVANYIPSGIKQIVVCSAGSFYGKTLSSRYVPPS